MAAAAKPCPHVGQLSLQPSRAAAGRVVFVHALSEEEVELEGPAAIAFSDAGFASVSFSDGSQKWAKDLLKRTVFMRVAGGEAAKFYYKLESGEIAWHHKLEIEFSTLVLGGEFTMQSFQRAVRGSWVRFSMNDIQEWEKQHQVASDRAAGWSKALGLAGAGSSAGRAGGPGPAKRAKKLKPVPLELSKEDLQRYMPRAKGSCIQVDDIHQRCRAFYPTEHSLRGSSSAPISKYGLQEAARTVLAWAWREHEAAGGEACPWEL